MIRSFKNRVTEAVFDGKCPKGFPPDLFKVARRKLEAVHAATTLDDLRSPPGNRLESLSGDRAGQHSIRINDQWRICFYWMDGAADEVEIVDYH
jgi:proteic killer suppression protein